MNNTKTAELQFNSILAPYIKEYIHYKRVSGIEFKRPVWYLLNFDRYCLENKVTSPLLKKEFLETWKQYALTKHETVYKGLISSISGFTHFHKNKRPGSYEIPKEEREYQCQSILAPFIKEFIQSKRQKGLKYKNGDQALKLFDRYCIENELKEPNISESFLSDWYVKSDSSSKSYSERNYIIRNFCIFLSTEKKISVFIPLKRSQLSHPRENDNFTSIFSKDLNEFIFMKQESGFTYETEKRILKGFDRLCIDLNIQNPELTKEIVQRWAAKRPSEGGNYRNKRVTVVRQFAKHLISEGRSTYVAGNYPSSSATKPHIFKGEETIAFFEELDKYISKYEMMDKTLPVLFRFYYCMGLRLNEAINLKKVNINLMAGSIKIDQAKGHKDRMVYLPTDLLELAVKYDESMETLVPGREFFFISNALGTKLIDTSLCRVFNRIWNSTGFAETVDKKPTIHCFRHALVVRKLEQWYAMKVDYTYWIPFLSAFLGHESLENTYYYVQLVDSSFPKIRETMKDFERLYPEVG